MDATREFTWGGGGVGEVEGGNYPTRAVLVVGGVRGRQPQRSVYRALSGVTFQDLDIYMRQASSCNEPAMPTEEDEGLDSLDSHAHTLTPSPDPAQRVVGPHDQPGHTEGGYFSLERCLSEEDAAHLHDSLENLIHEHSHQPNVHHRFPPNYPDPYQNYQQHHEVPGQGYGAMPTYVNPNFQHQSPYVSPQQRHEYSAGDRPYLPVGRNYPNRSGNFASESEYPPNIIYHQRETYPAVDDNMGRAIYDRQVRDVYPTPASYPPRDTYQPNYLYPNYSQKGHPPQPQDSLDKEGESVRKASVLSADSLEDLPLSPMSPISPQLPVESRKSFCYKDSLEDVRPRLVSELRNFFERRKSNTSTSSPESESLQEGKIEEEEEEPQDLDNQKNKISAEVQVDMSTSVDSDRNTSIVSDRTDETSSTTTEDVADITQESSEDPTKDIYEESDVVNPKPGDVAFLRATQDTSQTLLASTKLVQATLKPAAKATTFFICLGSKLKAPHFERSKKKIDEKESDLYTEVKEEMISSSEESKDGQSSSEVTEEEILHSTDSNDPAEYQESRLILRHFVSNWDSESPPPDDDSDIDEFFLVLDSTGGKGNFSFPSGSSSMISSLGSSSSDQKSDTNNSNDQDSYDDGNLADIGEPDTTSSSGLSPVIESTTDESSPRTPDMLETPDEKDGFLDGPHHNVIVKPFLGLGKGSARESHAGSVLGNKQTRVAGQDRLLPIHEELSQSGREFETIIDTVFCGSDDDVYPEDHGGNTTCTLLTPELTNPPSANSPSVSSPSSENGESCETLQCTDDDIATPACSRETLCYFSERNKRMASDPMQVCVATGNDSRHKGQSLGVGAVMSSQRHGSRPAGNYANPRYICENEVTCDSRSGASGEASGTAADPPLDAHTAAAAAAAALATCTFSFSVEDRGTPDLEALATLIAERIMSGSLPSTSARESGSGGTSAHLAGVTDSARLTCDEVIVSGSVAVSAGRGSDQPLHPHSSTPAPAAAAGSHVKKGESEVTLGPVINMNSDVLKQLVADPWSKKSGGEGECCAPPSGESDSGVRENVECEMSDLSSESNLILSSNCEGCQTDCAEVLECDDKNAHNLDGKVRRLQCDVSRQSSTTSDMGDEIFTDLEASCSTDSCVAKPRYSLEGEYRFKTPHYGAPRPVFPRKDSKGSTCESFGSRKTSISSTVTTPDDDATDISPGDVWDRRLSTSSGVSSLSEHSTRKFSCSSGVSSMSDDWEWFPGRKRSIKGQLGLSEYRTVSATASGERDELRKMSSASAASTQSSGVSSLAGSVSESGLNEGRKLSHSSGISCLSKIKEETKSISDVDLSKPESFEEDHTSIFLGSSTKETCHNTTLDGKRLSLPPPVWPREAQQDLAHTTCEFMSSLVGLRSWESNFGCETPEFLIKRAEILKNPPASRANLKLDLPLICPSSCPLRRKDYIGDHDCGHAHNDITSTKDVQEKRKSIHFEPKRIKAKPKMSSRSRRLTLHTFENIAEEWRKQQALNEGIECKAESVANLRITEPLPEDVSDEVEFRRDLVRDLEKLEAEIEAEVQALESESSHSKEEDDSTSIAVVFDSNESVLSTGSFSPTGSGNLNVDADTSMDVDTDAGDASKEALELSGTHFDASCPSVDEEKTSEDQRCVQSSEDGQNKRISSEVTAESGSHSPLPNSKSFPNLKDTEEAKAVDTTSPKDAADTQEPSITSAKSVVTRDSTDEIVPCSNYEFSEMTFPAMINLDDLEEQEAIENFSDEDLVSDADFEAFSETEHDTDMDNLNFELFEPHMKGDKIDGKMLSKRQKKLRKLRRKFSFSSSEKQPKDIKGTITSSLKRFKNAKDKIEKLVHRTLRSDAAPSHSSGESLEGSTSLSQSSGHHAAHTSISSPRTRGPLERSDSHSSKTSESQVSASLDRTECRTSDHSGSVGGVSRNTSKSSDDRSSVGPWDVRPHDGDESTYSWSDADSDFEYVPMEPRKTMVMCKEMCDNSNNESVQACKGPRSPQPRPAVERPTQSLTRDVPSASGNEGLCGVSFSTTP